MDTETNTDAYVTYDPTYNILYADSVNVYDQFISSLWFEKNNAINAVYDRGYITEDEAKQLKEEGFARRNEHTIIQLANSFDKITLCCNEFDDNDVNIIFKFSYFKLNGYVVDELNTDIVN
jgi:hypothetical protein